MADYHYAEVYKGFIQNLDYSVIDIEAVKSKFTLNRRIDSGSLIFVIFKALSYVKEISDGDIIKVIAFTQNSKMYLFIDFEDDGSPLMNSRSIFIIEIKSRTYSMEER
jgi:hypothetical protein